MHFDQSNYEKFQKWLKENEPEDSYYWKNNWWENNVFLRDRVLTLFDEEYEVIGSHYSKSILCPVLKTRYKGVEIIWQYNFYDWQIMVKSPKQIIFEPDDLNLFSGDGSYLYYQGIPDEYCFKKYPGNQNKEFAIDIYRDNILDVWVFAILIKKLIDKNDSVEVIE